MNSLFSITKRFFMDETRQERFKRLATSRTNAVLDKLRLIGNLANKTNYDYPEEDVRKMFSAVEKQLRSIKEKFSEPKKRQFRL